MTIRIKVINEGPNERSIVTVSVQTQNVRDDGTPLDISSMDLAFGESREMFVHSSQLVVVKEAKP